MSRLEEYTELLADGLGIDRTVKQSMALIHLVLNKSWQDGYDTADKTYDTFYLDKKVEKEVDCSGLDLDGKY